MSSESKEKEQDKKDKEVEWKPKRSVMTVVLKESKMEEEKEKK